MTDGTEHTSISSHLHRSQPSLLQKLAAVRLPIGLSRSEIIRPNSGCSNLSGKQHGFKQVATSVTTRLGQPPSEAFAMPMKIPQTPSHRSEPVFEEPMAPPRDTVLVPDEVSFMSSDQLIVMPAPAVTDAMQIVSNSKRSKSSIAKSTADRSSLVRDWDGANMLQTGHVPVDHSDGHEHDAREAREAARSDPTPEMASVVRPNVQSKHLERNHAPATLDARGKHSTTISAECMSLARQVSSYEALSSSQNDYRSGRTFSWSSPPSIYGPSGPRDSDDDPPRDPSSSKTIPLGAGWEEIGRATTLGAWSNGIHDYESLLSFTGGPLISEHRDIEHMRSTSSNTVDHLSGCAPRSVYTTQRSRRTEQSIHVHAPNMVRTLSVNTLYLDDMSDSEAERSGSPARTHSSATTKRTPRPVFAGKGWVSPHPLSSPSIESQIYLPSDRMNSKVAVSYEQWRKWREDESSFDTD